jgi:hypothetical protein
MKGPWQFRGDVWAADNGVKNGKGAVVVKFSPYGQVLMTLGHPGMPGDAQGYFNGASSVVVAPPNGDIVVGDGHGGNTNDRVVPARWPPGAGTRADLFPTMRSAFTLPRSGEGVCL